MAETQRIEHKIDRHNAEYWSIPDYGDHGQFVYPYDYHHLVAQGPLSALAKTAPHACDVPGCPGPVNLRRLAAFDELLAALKRIIIEATGGWAADPTAWMQVIEDIAEAAIAKAEEAQPCPK